jgi:hypothetical protein
MRRSLPRALATLLAVLTLAAALAPAAQAQAPNPGDNLYRFQLTAEGSTRVDVPLNSQTLAVLTFSDLSRDSPATVNPSAPPNTVLYHTVTFEAVPHEPDDGWTVFSPTSLISYGGTTSRVEVPFQVTAGARHTLYPVDIVASVRTADGSTYYVNATLVGFSLGARSFAAQVGGSFQSRPNTIIEAPIRLINLGMAPRQFDMNVTDNPCHMGVATSNNNLVQGKSEDVYPVSIETPASRLWYFSQLCTVSIQVFPSGQRDVVQTVFVSVQVNGGYLDPTWVFDTLAILLVLVLLLVFLARRKARVEEEILGKPQKPWTIPVEALYLKALRRKDGRAWYVVRHYLMEDEHRSALLWYKAYKKSTRGDRKKERLVVVQERAYERWKAAWRRDIDRPLRQADRHEARLQRRLDRRARKAHRRDLGKYRKVMRKMEAAHARQVERAGKRHAKEAARARKKGQPAPPRPVVPEPDYPDQPQPVPIALADHRWSRKAARFRARMVRRQGDLEVKFEKADARRLRKVRRKVHRLARRLDDPEFVEEHPLLQGS